MIFEPKKMMKNTDIAWVIPQSQWPFMCLIWKHLKSGPFYSRISMLLFFYRVCTTQWIQILISTVNHIKFLPENGFKFGINWSCECGKKLSGKRETWPCLESIFIACSIKYICTNQMHVWLSQFHFFNPLWQRKD